MDYSLHDSVGVVPDPSSSAMRPPSGEAQQQPQQQEIPSQSQHSNISSYSPLEEIRRSGISFRYSFWIARGIFQLIEWTLGCLEVWCHLLVTPQLSDLALYRLSNFMLAWHHVGILLSSTLPSLIITIPINNGNSSNEGSGASSFPSYNKQESSIFSSWPLLIPPWWLYVMPVVTTIIVIAMAVPYTIGYFRVPLHQGAIVTSLITLFCLEALLPLVLLTCTSLCLLQKVSWMSGLFVSVTVWIGVSVCSHWIRCIVYQNMGHG